MTRFIIESAGPENSAELCQLIRSAPMSGAISISLEREPDYFHAARVQGADASILIARDSNTGEAAGVGAINRRLVYVNGSLQQVAYLSDLRIPSKYRGSRLLALAYAHIREHLLKGDDFAQTIVVQDNLKALSLLTSGRAGLPKYFPCGDYTCPAVLIGSPASHLSTSLEILRATTEHIPAMQSFFDTHASKKQFYPYYNFSSLGNAYMLNQSLENFFLAFDKGFLVGIVGVWDQGAYKQTRIQGYSGPLRWLRPLINSVSTFTSGFTLPPPGSVIPSFYLHSMVIKDDDYRIFSQLIAAIRRTFNKSGYAYFLCGLDARDPLRQSLQGLKTRSFGGRHFLVSFGNDPRVKLRSGLFYLEAARI